MSKMQKAWIHKEIGTLDVLHFGDFPVPNAGPGQVLVKVRAAALNPVDYKRRGGLLGPYDCDYPAVPGCDVSGVVVELGEGVTKFKVGDEVYGDVQNFMAGKPKRCGSLAQYTAVEETLVAHKPHNLSFEEAASLSLSLLTAQQAFDTVNFQKGQSVFIVGGAGGVGSLAIQLAKHVYGASRIVATCSTGKVEFVKSLGADDVVDYTKQSYDQITEKFDFVLDTTGDGSKSYVVAKEEALIVDVAKQHPNPRVQFMAMVPSSAKLERVHPYIEEGKLKAVIDPKSPYAFSDVVEAFKHLESGRARGKIVISPIE